LKLKLLNRNEKCFLIIFHNLARFSGKLCWKMLDLFSLFVNSFQKDFLFLMDEFSLFISMSCKSAKLDFLCEYLVYHVGLNGMNFMYGVIGMHVNLHFLSHPRITSYWNCSHLVQKSSISMWTSTKYSSLFPSDLNLSITSV
jgi:hypothetical protein